MKKNSIIGCLMLGLLIFAQSAVGARYDYEQDYRYSGRDAVEMDDWLERGRAAVTESPVFSDGVRLTAWEGAEAYEPGLASAIFYFQVPRWAQFLKITIRYRDEARDDSIAGRLWIKSADRDQYEALDAGEEPPLYGDTFVLRSERDAETIVVPRSRHVESNRVEIHVVAEGKDCIDVRDIRVEFLETRPQITVVHRTYNDYWDRWPRHRYAYHYYYWGPLFWPRTVVVYECWDLPSPFYWITWRPWFLVNIVRVHHHHPWWGPRRYTIVYHVDVKHPLIKRRPLLRTRLKERQVYVTRTIRPKTVIRKTVPRPVRTSPTQQEVRLQTKAQTPRTFEATASRNPTQQHVKEQPVRSDTGREMPRVHTQTKAAKRLPAVNNPPARSERPAAAPERIQQKERAQPRSAQQQPRTSSRAQEGRVQAPAQRQVNKPATEVKPAPSRIQKDQARQQPQTRSKKDQGAVREPTRVQAAQDQRAKQGGAVQSKAKIGQGAREQSRREIRHERPQPGQRRHR